MQNFAGKAAPTITNGNMQACRNISAPPVSQSASSPFAAPMTHEMKSR